MIFKSIGIIHSPHRDLGEIPVQPVFAVDIEGTVIVEPEYAEGLKDLEGFSHVYLFYYFYKSRKTYLTLKPYLSDKEHGVLATRSEARPNKLGMSLVRLTKIEGNVIYIKDVDILDGTPLVDIKPYIQRFDSRENTRSGWQDEISNDSALKKGLRNYNNAM